MSALLVVGGAALVVYALRAAVPLAFGTRPLPDVVRRAGAFVLPAMMSALAAAALVPSAGSAPDPHLVLVALAGTAAAVRTQSVAWTFAAGLASAAVLSVAPF
jgi:branched-subunit amino acid transport protein